MPRGDSADGPPDELRLYRADNSPVADTGDGISVTPAELARAHHHSVTIDPSDATRHQMIIVTPVSNANGLVGILAVARSDHGLRSSINHRWTVIAIGGVLVALAALAISILLARWVGRPLRRLEHAAGELGAGDLSIRARAVGGPSEVREVAATFDAMADRIQSLVDSQRHFLSDVSHQIRTPLTAMRLRLELLEQDVDATIAGEVAGTLVEVHRLSRMVDGLLAVSRAEHAPTAIRPVPLAPVTAQRCLGRRRGHRTDLGRRRHPHCGQRPRAPGTDPRQPAQQRPGGHPTRPRVPPTPIRPRVCRRPWPGQQSDSP
ncbi:sensor histidine kinase [Candidatus Frankia alpina]|uniref:sensor histidine kinase n=1 Tax=Candidatus Frankia alpina TaxID=2699483 RepID=UPI001F1CC4F0|nr:HAMP domain-containing sensor histidine kinase [Candidatus Frankia alpina]